MPHIKRESLIFTVMMRFVMVIVMSIYNIALHMGEISTDVMRQARKYSSDSDAVWDKNAKQIYIFKLVIANIIVL